MLADVKRTTVTISNELDGGRRRLLAAAAGRSGHADTAQRIEEILAEEWSDPHSS
jgi:hypothetical protein